MSDCSIFQLDIDLVEYVGLLREGILEAYTGIVSGFKNTPKVEALLPHVPAILELVNRCLVDSEKTESTVKLAVGLVGDLADAFPNGQIKQLLLADWIANELRMKGRLAPETKRTLKWAREVRSSLLHIYPLTTDCRRSDGQARHRMNVLSRTCSQLTCVPSLLVFSTILQLYISYVYVYLYSLQYRTQHP